MRTCRPHKHISFWGWSILILDLFWGTTWKAKMSSRQMWPPRGEFFSVIQFRLEQNSTIGLISLFYLFATASNMFDTVWFRHFILHFRPERTLHPPWNFFQTVTGPRCSARPVGLLNKRLCWQRPKHQSEMEFGPDSRSRDVFYLEPGLTRDTWLLTQILKNMQNYQKQKFLLCFAFALAQWGSALSISSYFVISSFVYQKCQNSAFLRQVAQ